MNDAPIAVFDSGLGGLSVWREIRRLLPHESLFYFGDGANCPYGPKPHAEVNGYVDAAARMLIREKGAKMLVVACNAATAAAINNLREAYDVPIVGMEPAVKPAALSTRTGVIGILATAATLSGGLYHDTAAKWGEGVTILDAVGEGFVELVERGLEDTPEAEQTVRRALEPMLLEGADRIVLGCTHYPFLEGAMRRVIAQCVPGADVQIIDPAPAVARRVADLLSRGDALAGADNVPRYEFYTAGDAGYLARLEAKAREKWQTIL